jgi:serpin B
VIVVGKTAIFKPPVDLRFDRPFIFAIRDVPTGSILFLGRVTNPKG